MNSGRVASSNFIQLLKRILGSGKSYIPFFLLLGIIGTAMIPIEVYGLLLSRKLIDEGFLRQDWSIIKNIIFVLIILFVLRSIIQYVVSFFSTLIEYRINMKFQNDLFSHLMYLPVPFFTKEPTGQLMSRILDDATRFSSIFRLIFGATLIEPVKSAVLLGFFIYVNARMSIIMILSSCFSFFILYRMGNIFRKISKDIQQTNAAIFSFVEQIFSNLELIKSKVSEQQTALIFGGLLQELIALSLKTLKVTLIARPILQVLKYLTIATVFIYGSWMISNDSFTIGDLTIFIGATFLFFNALFSIGNTYGTLRDNLARLEVIYSILDRRPERSIRISDEIEPLDVNFVEFSRVFFSYHPGRAVLKDVSFKITRGEVLGITGQSGSGKTTLVRLLARFYEPHNGQLKINGRSLHQFDLSSLRYSIGIVFQDNLILNDTIKNNIAYGVQNAPMEKIVNAAEIAGAHEFINACSDQYDTIVGEGGKSMSGGERQRLSIARAIINNPEILVIDEGTSFLEVAQEAQILNALKKSRPHKITIIISHRLSAISFADRILVLDNGSVVEMDFRSLAGIHQN